MPRLATIAVPFFIASLMICIHAADNTPPSLARPPKLSDLFGDEVLARGKGVEVKQSHLDQAFVSLKASLAARGQSVPEEGRILQEAKLLDRLIVTQLLTNRATLADRTNALALAETYFAETRKGASSEEVFLGQLKALGVTQEQFNQRIKDQALADAVLQRELRSTISVSDSAVQDFYATGRDVLVTTLEEELDKRVKDPSTGPQQISELKKSVDELRKSNLARLEQPERVKVAHVFMTTRDRQSEQDLPEEIKSQKRRQMEQVRDRALAGEEFTKLVMELSEDRAIKETRGEYTFGRDAPFAEEFKAASFSLELGKISDIVSTLYGYHVIKLLERLPAQKMELEKVSADLKDFLVQQEVLKAMPGYFEKLKKSGDVQILSPKYLKVMQELEKRTEASKATP